MSLEQPDSGINVGKETVEIDKGKLQERMDAGMSKEDAIALGKEEAAVTAILDGEMLEGDVDQNEQKKALEKAAAIKAAKENLDSTFEGTKEEAGKDTEETKKDAGEADKKPSDKTKQGTQPAKEEAEEKETIPDLKLEGETITINGKTYLVEGAAQTTDGKAGFKLKNLQPGLNDNEKSEVFDAETVKSTAENRRKEMWNDYKLRFGFTDEDIRILETDNEYKNLSLGQRRFVLDSLTSATLEKVDEIAEESFKSNGSKKGFWGKVGDGIWKGTRMNREKTEAFKAFTSGGIEKVEDDLGAIITRVGMMNVPMIENEKHEVEVQYSKQFGNTLNQSAAALHAQRAYDQAATALQKIPPEWESDNATRKQRSMAADARAAFHNAELKCFSEYKFGTGGKNYEQFMTGLVGIDQKVELNRFMNAHPENERVLQDLYKSEAKKNFDRDIGDRARDLVMRDQKLAYGVLGAGVRKAIGYFSWSGLGTAVGGGGIMGAIRGYGKARQKVRDQETAFRRGKTTIAKEDPFKLFPSKDKKAEVIQTDMLRIDERDASVSEDDPNAKNPKRYLDKINDIIFKMEAADEKGNPEEAAFYKTMLDNRIAYTLERARLGKISFGDKENRIANQAAFASVINRAERYSGAADPEAQEQFKNRIASLMSGVKRERRVEDDARQRDQNRFVRNYTIRNAAIGAAFGGIGYGVMHGIEKLREAGVFDMSVSHEAAGNLDGNAYAPDKTYVAMPDPREYKFVDGEPIKFGHDDVGVPDDAYIRKGEGIEHALRRQIEHDPELAKELGWKEGTDIHKFSGSAAHKLATQEGYIDNANGKEVRVNYEGEKTTFYKINRHSDGTIHVDEGQGTHYTENEAFDQNDRYSAFDREQNHGEHYEYIYKNGEKVPIIDHGTLTEPSDHIDKGAMYEEHFSNENNELPRLRHEDVGSNDATDAMENTAGAENVAQSHAESNVVIENHAQNAQQAVETEYTYHEQPGRPLSPNRGSMRYSHGPGRTINDANPAINYNNVPGHGQEYVGHNTIVDHQGIHRTEDNIVVRKVRINGRGINYNTGSTDPLGAFDSKVNNNYDRLMNKVFGERNSWGDFEVNKKVLNMLKHHNAIDDLSSTPAQNTDKNIVEYLDIVKKVHDESGLEPLNGQTTEMYLRQALQQMKNDGKNIRRFVSYLITQEETTEGAAQTAVKQASDDVYR